MVNQYCKDCEKDCFEGDKDYYMIKHELPEKSGVGKGMLCMSCIKGKLGHKLTKQDILKRPLTEQFNPYTKEILKG